METMQDYSIYCTPEQTKRAYKLGAPIEAIQDYSNGNVGDNLCVLGEITDKDRYGIGSCIVLHIPTAEQMTGWLRGKGVNIDIIKLSMSYIFNLRTYRIYTFKSISYENYPKTILAAIDAALDYLE